MSGLTSEELYQRVNEVLDEADAVLSQEVFDGTDVAEVLDSLVTAMREMDDWLRSGKTLPLEWQFAQD